MLDLLQPEQLSIIVVTVFLSIVIVFLGSRIKKIKTEQVPKGIIFTGIIYVETMVNLTISSMGEKHGRKMAAYMGTVFLYLFFANTVGLFGLETPTSNLSVTIVMALISWLMIQYTKIRENGFWGFIKGFFEPIFPFVIPNFFGTMAPLISLSLRLFGNVLSGSVIMGMLYTFTGWLSGFVPVIGGFNFISMFITPVIHLYFDLFAGFLQAFLFMTLTSILIAVEYND